MAHERHASSSSPSTQEEARALFDDYDSLNDDRALENQKAPKADKPTPLPIAQLATLCTVRLVDPIVFTQIFPYVNEMIERLHITDDPSKIGFYSGLVVSGLPTRQLSLLDAYHLTGEQLRRRSGCVYIPMGKTLWCAYYCSVTFDLTTIISVPYILRCNWPPAHRAPRYLWYRFSHPFHGCVVHVEWRAIRPLSRCVLVAHCPPMYIDPHTGGLFSGNVAVIHSVLGEITDSSNQATAFPLYGLCWPLGGIIG